MLANFLIDTLAYDRCSETPAPAAVVQALEERAATLERVPDPKQAAEALRHLAPLAGRLGLSSTRTRIEDAAFAQLDRSSWQRLRGSRPRAADLQRVIDEARSILTADGITGVVSGRVKGERSTHRKMERKGVRVDEIVDRSGVRVRVETVEEAYRVLDRLHRLHTPIADEFDDYILRPKPSGYRSLHTAVVTPVGVVEYQIRTHQMHHDAEHGPAAHWRYKQV